ncbi:MAG: T9SS type A sorting domain-containing protein [Bacteroidales bacterium]|nr:T9SS type A sorting domain-containing protein [Bacteroidales bacterium]
MKRALLLASLLLLLLSLNTKAQVRPTTPLLDATTEKQNGEYLAIQISSTDYFWIDWGSGVPKRYTKGSYGEENPIYDKVSGSNIKIYGESISHILAPSGGWTQATVGLSLKLLNIDLSNSPLAKIDLSEAALLNSLNVSYCKLQELPLGKKSKLTYLWAQGNQLSSIDLSGCSSLQNIDISQNQLAGTVTLSASIANADLSDNKLTEVVLAPGSQIMDLSIRNNQLSSFSVSEAPHLRMLDLFKNQLTAVSLQGKLQELVALNLGKNQISDIDLTQCTALRGLTLSYNPMKKVDLAPCKELTAISIHHTSLTELDLSHTVKLKNIEAMNGKLTSIDLSPCLELIEVWLSQNSLADVKLAPNNESLLCLQLAGNKLTPEKIESIIEALPNISDVTVPSYQADYLKHLSIRYNPSTDKANLKPAQDKGWTLDVMPNGSYPYLSFATQKSKDADIEIAVTAPMGSDIQFWGNEQKTVKAESAITVLKEVTLQDQQSYCLESKATKLDFSKANLSELELYNCSDLSSLQVQGGTLTSLDLTQAPQLKELYCLQNNLSALSMTKLIQSLPDRSASNDGVIYAVHLDETLEKNVCTKEHVDEAKLKGWSIKAWDPSKEQYVNYVPAAVPASSSIVFTTAKAVGETISLAVKSEGEVIATGIKEKIVADGNNQTYTLTAQTVTLQGDVEVFQCNNNSLTSIELFEAERLKELSCSSNELTTLDVKGCPNLEKLICASNQIAALDLSACKKLTKLLCHANQLTELNLSACPSLQFVWCQRNQIASLDLSNCKNLQKLKCGDNKLSTLDVKPCEALTDLFCEDNQIACSQMEAIIASLPQRHPGDEARFIAITVAEDQNPNVGNVITKHAVSMAKSKNWEVYSTLNGGDDEVTPYDGRDGNCVDNVLSYVVTVSENANGRIVIKGTETLETVPYGTELTVEVAPEAGYELDKLMANDEDITASKRFVVKSDVKVSATFKTGVDAVTRESISLYPNPAKSEANLLGVAPQTEVIIYGTDGRRLQTITADQDGHAVLLLEGLPEGTYIVSFRDNAGVLTTHQLTIKR